MKRPLKIALLFLICHSLNGQSINDVLSALPICGLGNYDISLPKSEFSDLGDFNCFPDDASFEHYEMLKIHGIIKGGTLSFDFIPVNANDDIDFIVYKLDGTNASPIRCMASGKSLDLQGADCSGPTGLAEFATDLIEYEGCEEGSDNYLRYLDVEVGEEYLILVTNYKSGNPCAFHLYGTAIFGQAELQLSDSLTFCKDYIFSYKVDKLPGYQYEWSIGSATSDSFELLGNLLTNKYVVNTSSIGAFKYKLKYYNPNGTCAPTYTNVSNIKIEECKECSDGIKNFDETDLDCGGPKCPQCSGCDIITDLDLQDITVNCEGDYYDTIPLIGNYCNVYYDGIFNLEISEEPCKKTIVKSWTFELPDTNIVLYQRTIIDKTPKIINESLISDIHVQCKADLPIVPELYYIDPCIGDTIKPFYDSKELYDGNGDLIERRFWKFESRCSEDFILSQDILIKYTQGISYPKSPEDISLSCEISTPNREEFKVIVDCETILDPVFSEVTTTTSCSTIINRKYHFYLDGIVDTTFEHNIFKIDTIAPVPTSIPPVELRFLCANDTVTVPLFFANDNCDGEVYPVFMMENDGGLGTKESPLWIYKSWEFSDACGNTTVLNQNIKIQNDEQILLPEGPPDLSFECLDAVPEPANLIATAGCGQFVNGILTETRQGNSCHMTILRRWTFKHLDLEEKVLEQRITVDNYRLPQFIVPPDTIIECINNYEEQLYGSPTEIATACGISSDVSYTNTFTDDKACPGSGVILRTWKVKDLCGNEKVAVQKIEMQDHTAPVPIQSFPDIIIACKQEIPEIQDAQAIDYCTGEKISAIISEENNGGAATPDDHLLIKRKRVYKDACGNEFETIQNIRVTGSTEVIYPDPPGTYTVYCVGDVRPAETLVATNGCDNRSVGVVTETTEGDSCYLKVIRTWTFSFKGLDDKSITQTIYVKNQEIPEFSVPENITIACDANAIPDFTGVPSNINTYCNIGTTINYIDENKTEVCVGTGFWKRSWIATDACGNVRQKYQTIFFEDKTPPNLPPTPDDQEAACGKTPLLTLTAQDNCSGEVVGIMTSEVSNGGGGYWGNPEVFTRTYEFIDDCGNKDFVYEKVSIIGTDVVNVEDAPKDDVISCIDDLITPGILRAVNSCGQEIIAVPVRNDNGNLACSATVTFTWTFEFPGLDPIVRQQTVTIENNSVPEFDVPAGKLISCEDPDAPSNTGNPSNLTSYCGELPKVSYSDVRLNGDCVNSYDIIRTWKSSDRCGNEIEHDQVIEVRDTKSPTIHSIPSNLTVSCEGEVPTPNTGAVNASDNCGGTPVITVDADVISNRTCENRYTITRRYMATDECGNISTAIQTIIVRDVTGPEITSIPANVTVSCIGEVPLPNTSLVRASDNCGGTPVITVEADVISNRTCANRYMITRRYVATDVCGNTSIASQTITVNDQTDPVISSIPANVTVNCAGEVPLPNTASVRASDNCGGTPIITVQADVVSNRTCTNRYSITRRYVATDECGNTSIASQTITVDDKTDPIISSIPANVTVNCAGEVPLPNTGSVRASDNCGGTPLITGEADVISNRTCPNRYTITRRYVATDECGNISTAIQTITVDDQTDPIISSIPANVTVSCAGEVPLPNVGSVRASDNCGGAPVITVEADVISNRTCPNRYTITRRYVATDACGNTSASNQVITVNDLTGPVISSVPPNVIVSCAEEVLSPNIGAVNASDNCGGTIAITVEADVINNQTCENRYTITRIYVATDACGNESRMSQTITVNDETGPRITTIPSNETVSCAGEVPSPNTGAVSANDNCGGSPEITVEADVISNWLCENRYTITRVYVATDACGNESRASQVIRVDDQTDPIISSIPVDEIVSCVGEVPSPNTSEVSASDNCGDIPEITVESDVISNWICVNRYSIRRNYVATDVCGNTSVASQIITVNDQTEPTIQSIPMDETVSCAGEVPSPNTGAVIASDNCGDLPSVTVLSDNISNWTCANRYDITRTYVVSDACGNTSSASQTIVVDDQTSPEISFIPSDVTVNCAGEVPLPNTGDVNASDNCTGRPIITVGPDEINDWTCNNRYTITRRYTATDECGNESSMEQSITVHDDTGPTIHSIPSNLTVSCSGEVPTPNTGAVNASDNCGGTPVITVEADVISNRTCENRYTITRRYIATDECGNISTAIQTITVRDATGPEITSIPANVTVSCIGEVPLPNTSLVRASDNCGGTPVITFEADVISNRTCANRYTIIRRYVATDVCGNTSIASQTITVNDQTDPVINSIPANVTVNCAGEVPLPNTASVRASDNCGGVPAITVQADVVSNRTCTNRYSITRRYVATDECGNTSIASQTITVDDQTDPIISSIPANVTVNCAGEVPLPNTGSVRASDNCGGTPLITVEADVISNRTCPNRYTITRRYVATDECNNTSAAIQIITVDDRTDPIISSIPANVTVSCAGEVPLPNVGSVRASDNCGGAPVITVEADVISNRTCPNRYTITRRYVATDACGNTSASNQVITVNDLTGPVISSVPANVVVSCAEEVPSPNIGSVNASDNCGGTPVITVEADVISNRTCENRYTITRRYVATDACGNTTASNQIITVNDLTGPVISSVPANVTVSCVGEVPLPNTSLVRASDNCGGTPVITVQADVIINRTCANRYTITRRYIATDVCGNTSIASQTITVEDQTDPVISSIPANVTVNCAGEVPLPNTATVRASDNCGGVPVITVQADVVSNRTCTNRYSITRRYVATDECGNTSIASQTITVDDQTDPIISSIPANVTVNCAGEVPLSNTGSVRASDNCGGTPLITVEADVISNRTCPNRYTITRRYVATDECNNTSAAIQIITVDDQTDPIISSIPANVTVSCAGEVPLPNVGSVRASDNCGGAPVITVEADVISNRTCPNRYTITRRYVATDACGNTSASNQVITVNDLTGPVISSVPANVVVSCAEEVPSPNIGSVNASDNCGGTPVITVEADVISNRTCENRYTITRRYVATDECGNTSASNQIITVNDLTGPVISSVPANVTVSCVGEVPLPNTSLVRASDNCGGTPVITVQADVISNRTCANRYTITRRYIATDVCGNTSIASQTITVEDQTDPVISSIPANVTVNCAGEVPLPNTATVRASDNCGGVPVITVQADVISNRTCTNRYSITRRYVATDECGNTSIASQTITVDDQTEPVINSIPANVTVSCAGEVPLPNTGSVRASENCGGAPVITVEADVISNRTCPNRYTITRRYVATDACGNTSASNQMITVNDLTGPIITTIPQSLIVSCSGEVPLPNTGLVRANDNCGGTSVITVEDDVITNKTCENKYTITRRYVATDECENQSFANQTIRVFDDRSPVIGANLSLLSLDCDQNLPSQLPLSALNVSDCSPIANYTMNEILVGGEGNPSSPQIRNRVYTVTDVCGNSISKTQQLELIDYTPGRIITDGIDFSCPGNQRTFYATGGSSYRWSNGSTNSQISLRPDSPFSISLDIINNATNQCVTHDSYDIQLYNTLVDIDYSAGRYCANDVTAQVFMQDAVSYAWFIDNNLVSTESYLNLMPYVNQSGYVTVLNSAGCGGSINVSAPFSSECCNPPDLCIQDRGEYIELVTTNICNQGLRREVPSNKRSITSTNYLMAINGSPQTFSFKIWKNSLKPGQNTITVCWANNPSCCTTLSYFKGN